MIKLIAEIGSNHNQDIKRCEQLIKEAKKSGFWGVKFQVFKAEKLTIDEGKQKAYKKQELPLVFIPKISELCKKYNLKFGCTPFYIEAIPELYDYVDFFKISSFDILREYLITACLLTNKDVYFSLGLAETKNINRLLDLIIEKGNVTNNYYLMHCVSDYPTMIENCSMKRIQELFVFILNRNRNNIHVGYSDHTKDVDVLREALSLYAQVIEMHFDLDDKKGSESRYEHCWTPKDIIKLCVKMNKINTILNSKFKLGQEKLNMRADSITGLRK